VILYELQVHLLRWAIVDRNAPPELAWFSGTDLYWSQIGERHLFKTLKHARRRKRTLSRVWYDADIRIVRVMA